MLIAVSMASRKIVKEMHESNPGLDPGSGATTTLNKLLVDLGPGGCASGQLSSKLSVPDASLLTDPSNSFRQGIVSILLDHPESKDSLTCRPLARPPWFGTNLIFQAVIKPVAGAASPGGCTRSRLADGAELQEKNI